jgi:arylsulfatase A-like enzyme
MRTLLLAVATVLACGSPAWGQAAKRPNILWITCEDIGPHLGCYGDRYSVSPNLDKLAARGMIYRHAWSNAPVCAPARTSIISGLYPTSTGAEHMRSMTRLPPSMRMFPALLRLAGYYCTNHIKEDYNLAKDGGVWDESSKNAHWKNRKPGQPFFAVFNILITHESQIRTRPHKWVHDPARAPLPAYHPDTPEVRQDWAQYYDNITTMDQMAAKLLRELEEAGVAEDTIIFFYGDHGSGMPRHKRSPYNSGLQVPLICYVPPRYRNLAPKDYMPGGSTERLVSFVDLGPTMLSLAGVQPPATMQGHAFMGKYEAAPQPYLYGFRGRMDERYDLIRSVRDQRHVYVRNYLPHKIGGQHVAYMFVTPTTRVWKQLYDAGKLKPPQTYFWEPRPPEELYDLTTDPDEVKNLAASPAHQETLERLRRAEQAWVLRVRDVGFLPEGEIHTRSQGSTPYEMGHDDSKYPLKRIFHTAELASSLNADALPDLKTALKDSDSAVRYWAALGMLMRGKEAVATTMEELRRSLADTSPYVRIVAAEALERFGTDTDLKKALLVLLELAPVDKNGPYVSMYALNAVDSLGRKAASARAAIAALPRTDRSVPGRMAQNIPSLIDHILTHLP